MDMSVVIPVKNRPLELARAIRSILRQTLPPLEIIVVDQTVDDCCERAARGAFADSIAAATTLAYHHEPGLSGASEARNFGLLHAKGSLIVFSDDDAELEPNGLESFSRIFREHSEVVAAGGVITNYAPPNMASRIFTRVFFLGQFFDERQPIYWNWKRLPQSSLIPTTKLNGGMMCFRREILEQAGTFDERLHGCCIAEDIELTQRILRLTGRANSVVLTPSVRILHEALGPWRVQERAIEFSLISKHYLLAKNLKENPLNYLRYGWMAFGILLRCVVSSVRRLSSWPLRSYIAGLRGIWNGYRDCPFIKPLDET
jgi:GT2 family glycosyltransferase